MDETNPAYENFRNKMQAFGQPIKGTTRKVSASKFLGRDDLEERIKINEKKITLLKDIIKTQQMTTGMMIASLTQQSPVVGLEKEISDLKDLVGSIKETLVEQTKFEIQRFSEQQRLLETERRKKRESMLEGIGKRTLSLVRSATDGIVKPVQNIFMGIIRFITTIFLGRFLIKFLQFFTNPANIGIVTSIADFIGNNFPVILTSLVAAGVALAALGVKLLGLQGTISLLTGGSFLGSTITGIGARGATKGITGNATKSGGVFNFFNKGDSGVASFGTRRTIKMNKGGLVPGTGNTDSVPAMLTPGEIVISKPAVERIGAINLLNLNREAGKTNKPKRKGGRFYANDGMVVPNPFGFNDDSLISKRSRSKKNSGIDPKILKLYPELDPTKPGDYIKLKRKSIPIDLDTVRNFGMGMLKNPLSNFENLFKETKMISQFEGSEKNYMKNISKSINQSTTKFKSNLKNNIPSPPIETEGEDGGGFDNLSDLFKGMGAFTSESNDFQEDVLAAPLVDADPLKEAVVIR